VFRADAAITFIGSLGEIVVQTKRVEAVVTQKQIASQAAEDQLRAEVDQLRAEHSRLMAREREIMELIGASTPERILHDIRNLLNERMLLKALCDEI
jgi:hypothetical protein